MPCPLEKQCNVYEYFSYPFVCIKWYYLLLKFVNLIDENIII